MITITAVKLVFHQGELVNQACICDQSGTLGESILKSDQNLCITITLSGKPLYPLERTNKRSRVKVKRPRISKIIIVINSPSKSKNQVIFGSNFDPGLDTVNTLAALFIRMEPFDM